MSYKNISILYFKRLILKVLFNKKFQRSQTFVQNEYEDTWTKWESTRGGSGFFSSKPIPAFIGNGSKIGTVHTIDIQGQNIRKIAEKINELNPKTVLELGSGVGINLYALSVLCPKVQSWHGIELTQSGITIAERLRNNIPFDELSTLTGINKNDIVNRIRPNSIVFTKGDILNMPFNDNSFDLVFSHDVFEQMPHVYEKGMREARRVTSKYAIFIEAFKEAQRNIFQKMHQSNVDYFRWSYKKVIALGFKILSFTPMQIAKKTFSTGMLVCEKNSD